MDFSEGSSNQWIMCTSVAAWNGFCEDKIEKEGKKKVKCEGIVMKN